MRSVDEIIKKELVEILLEKGFSQTNDTENICKLVCDNKPYLITAQLIVSEKIDSLRHGSSNGNKIQAIGYFKFRLPPAGVSDPAFFIFGFHNHPKDCIEFLIIPTYEIIRRHQLKNRTTNEDHEIELQFWLLEDNLVFETNGISGEGEWWYINGRMAEKTDWDYSTFFNNWDGMIMT